MQSGRLLEYIALILCGLFLGGSGSPAFSGTYYVSPSGTASWTEAQNILSPCSAQTAMQNAVAGDTVYFRAGVYEVGQSQSYHAELEPANSGTPGNPIVFAAYPGETPIINGTTSGDNTFCIGATYHDYITWDGFTIRANNGERMGGILVYQTTGSVIKNCSLNGGTREIPTDDNRDLLRIEKAHNTLIKNCTIYNAISSINDDDICAIKTYHDTYLTIENCEIYNCTNGIVLKSDADDTVIRYNFIHDCHRGLLSTQNLVEMQTDRVQIYHNVFANCTFAGIGVSSDSNQLHANDWEIYNNTIFNAVRGINSCYTEPGHGWKIYNNIVVSCTKDNMCSTRRGNWLEADHNQFGTENFRIIKWLYDSAEQNFYNLSSWKNSNALENGSNPGTGSLSSDPKFVNASGTMSQLDDFRLAADSPCRGAGRNGVDIGANIDLVGVNSAGETGQPPSSPPNLRISSQ